MTDRFIAEAHERARRMAVVVADETGVVQSWSDGAVELFGYSSGDALGRRVGDLIVPPTMRQQHEDGVRRFAAGERSTRLGGSFAMWAQHADGSHVPVELTLYAVELPTATWILGVAVPLTDAPAPQTLGDEIVNTVFERAPEAITLLDPLGRQIRVNAAGSRMFGLGDDGRYPIDGRGFIHPDDSDRVRAHFDGVLSGTLRPDEPCRYRVISADGGWVWLETVVANLVDVPAVGGFVAFSRNVTADEQRRIELDAAHRATEDARDRLRRLADARLAFAASTSHEIRTPLSSISSAVEALLADPSIATSPQRAYLDLIGRNSHRLARLVEDLLAFSRLEAGQLTPRLDPVDPLQVIHDVVTTLEPVAAARGQRIVATLNDGPLLSGDEDQIRQIVENLLGNAVKFADPDSTIDVVCDHGPDGWTITVTNDGPAIAPADAERMFEPFVRVGRTEHTTPGTGLGLPLARGLAELHGGSLTWDPSTSRTRFLLVLPTT